MMAINSENHPADRDRGFRVLLRTLRYRNYRLFFFGQGISLIGTWMQQIALSWLVYRLTNSVFLLGLVGFATRAPIFAITPLAGVLADRWNRHRIMVVTQILSMLQAFILAGLVYTNLIAIWHVIALSLFIGLVNALDIPARQSFIVDMVENKDDLGNAIALNSSLVNAARLLGPSLAGILVATAGEGACFLVNALSFFAVIIALLLMTVPARGPERRRQHVLHQLREGAAYVFGFAPMRAILLLVSLVSVMGMPYTVLMPVYAKDIFHGGPHTLGFLMASAGLGALVGAVFLASKRTVIGLDRWIVQATLIFGAGLVAFAFSRSFWLSLALLALVGFGMIVQLASSNTVLQTLVEDDKRGRLMSFYAMAFMGMAPFGALLAGSLAAKIGAPYTVMVGGVSCLVAGLLFAQKLPALRRLMRPIYVQKGILPEVAQGLQAASDSPTSANGRNSVSG
jgi:MFS family permease